VALLEARDPDLLLLVMAPRLDREAQGADWVRAIETHGAWLAVWPVDAGRLVDWLRGRSRKLGLEANAEALELLASRIEGNLLAAHQELSKLTWLARDGAVTVDTVLASVADSARFDVFQLGEAVLLGETTRALRMLAGLRAEGTEATLALWALTRALRDLWTAHTGGAAPPAWQRRTAALGKALERAPWLSFPALAQRAVRADRMIKGRLIGDAWDEMALLVTELCGQPLRGLTAAPPARVSSRVS
jgi:DNA polymerase-3 subunit delta